MSDSELVFTFFYILLCMCIFYPPTEFITLGLTIENLFANLLGTEEVEFIRYHQRRTSLTLFIHSCLPALYFLVHYLQFNDQYATGDQMTAVTWRIAQKFSILAVLITPAIIVYWMQHDWSNHPISKMLNKFANSARGYASVAEDIGVEFRRQDVLNMKINSITSLIATENWIIKTTPYIVYFAHQSDTTLNVNKSETFTIAEDTNDSIQIINISVKSTRPGIGEFQIRINALDFRNLQDRISRPITIASNIQFHQSIIDRFIEVFKAQVALNPVFRTNQVADSCFACMLAEPNIKLHKQCLDVNENGDAIPEDQRCRNCYCRPMWCVDCLARWFASRQNEFEKEVWLEKKCSCPLCRAPFCMLDVCYIEKIES
ncbi:unnamed protein product [Hermetia illucens]|uniref:E3 ubiquitin-protein ligase TM129 n=1 Tax=Hermetia illucens TaxID=343691 RepID=A0A7R8YTW7_HERIL|nr:E3 ubiquitin-protein ligase TM129 [Hermetia illucens]CAD7084076.1 unnamed protein product [Hermetia illucens]